jgi:hypothetical protein
VHFYQLFLANYTYVYETDKNGDTIYYNTATNQILYKETEYTHSDASGKVETDSKGNVKPLSGVVLNGTTSAEITLDNIITSFDYSLDDTQFFGTSKVVAAATYLEVINKGMRRESHALENGGVANIITPKADESGILPENADNLENRFNSKKNVNKTLDNVNATLDSNARVNIQSALANLDKTLANASQLSRKLNDMAPEVNDIVKNLNVLSKGLSEGTNDIKGTLANVNSITSQLSKAELTETLNNLKSLLSKLQDPNGSVGKLLTTDSLHNSVNTLVQDVDILVKRITENPKKYIKVSVF